MGTPTTNKGYTVPTLNGDFGTWGNEINGDLGILDTNLGGSVSISCAGNSNVTATTGQAQNLAIILTGALTGSIDFILPAVGGLYIIQNATSGAYTITVITSAGGSTGVIVPQGFIATVWSDATNVYAAGSSSPGNFKVQGTLATSGTLSVAGNSTLTGNATVGGSLNVTGATAFNASGTAVQVPNGLLLANIIETTGSQAASQSGWAYTPTGPGAASGSFNFGVIASGAGMLAGNFFATSDARLKSEIQTIAPEDGEKFVNASRPVTYIKSGAHEAGFLAQDQVKAGYGDYVVTMPHEGLPETTDADGMTSFRDVALHLDYNNYIAYLTAALQRAFARISALEAKS